MAKNTIQDILDNDFEQNNDTNQENDNPAPTDPVATTQPAVQNSSPKPAVQPAVPQPAATQSTVPQGINEPLPTPTAQDIQQSFAKTSLGKKYLDNNKLPQLSEKYMENVRQGTNIFDIIDKLYKPDPVDEDSINRNRMLGSIGEGIKILGQMFGANRGAYIQQNNPKDSLTNYYLKKEDDLRDKYEKQMDIYKRMKLNAYFQQRNEEKQQKQIEENRQYQSEMKKENRDWQEKQANDNREFQSKESALNRANQKDIEKIQQSGLNTRNAATIAETKKYHEYVESKGGSSTKVDYKKLAVEGMSNPEFNKYMYEHPELFYIIKKDPYTQKEISKTQINPELIGRYYELYKQNNNQKLEQDQQQTTQENDLRGGMY
ncbi:MAG: hypothetical protein FWD60_08680 [Candidatus Azobacteroides sp.]|nr:hypothetical protein [Candidatus Azobacteroides sp.]